jgi:hypothetical protein
MLGPVSVASPAFAGCTDKCNADRSDPGEHSEFSPLLQYPRPGLFPPSGWLRVSRQEATLHSSASSGATSPPLFVSSFFAPDDSSLDWPRSFPWRDATCMYMND